MVIVFELDEKLLGELDKDIGSFLERVIDISHIPTTIASHLNIELAGRFGITQKELAFQLIENHIRELASKVNIEVVCLSKDQVEKETNLLEALRVGRIVLIK